MATYTIGIDFGKNGCRALLVDTTDGSEVACSSVEYNNGIMINNFFNGVPLPENWAIADPQDYIDVVAEAVNEIVENVQASEIMGLGIAFSSCCVMPVKADGTPLCALPEFKNNPHAYIKVTRHRSAVKQAEKIGKLAKQYNEPWVATGKNEDSNEWMLPKVLEIIDEAPQIYEAADFFMEATDWLVWQLTGNPVRNAFSASFKAQIDDKGDGPSTEFLRAVNPMLENFYKTKLNIPVASPITRAGGLTRSMASLLGLKPGTAVAVGGVDVLTCLPALDMCEEGGLVGILGETSTFITISKKEVILNGIARGVKGSIIPEYYTYKSNLKCVGDNYAWFLNNFVPPEYHVGAKAEGRNLHSFIAQKMMRLAPGENGIIAINWHKGSYAPIEDKKLSTVYVGMDKSTRVEHLYRAIIEGMAFDTRYVIEEYTSKDIDIDCFYGVGTIAERNPFISQLYADILGIPVRVAGTSKSPALGAAIVASAISGVYESINEAAHNMGVLKNVVYFPNITAVSIYDEMYQEYKKVREYFSVKQSSIMHNLKDIKAKCKL